jgi:hypothetical protein
VAHTARPLDLGGVTANGANTDKSAGAQGGPRLAYTGAGWAYLAGRLTSQPAAAAGSLTGVPDGQSVDVFARGTDNAAWYNEFLGGTAGWNTLGGQITSGLGAAYVSPGGAGTVWILALGTDNRIWMRTGAWPAVGAWARLF